MLHQSQYRLSSARETRLRSESQIYTRNSQNTVPEPMPGKIALLTNCIPPYFLPVLRSLTQLVEHLRIFVSTPMEADRQWRPFWDGVDVVVQKAITSRHLRFYKRGYKMSFFRHFPYDCLPLL